MYALKHYRSINERIMCASIFEGEVMEGDCVEQCKLHPESEPKGSVLEAGPADLPALGRLSNEVHRSLKRLRTDGQTDTPNFIKRVKP